MERNRVLLRGTIPCAAQANNKTWFDAKFSADIGKAILQVVKAFLLVNSFVFDRIKQGAHFIRLLFSEAPRREISL